MSTKRIETSSGLTVNRNACLYRVTILVYGVGQDVIEIVAPTFRAALVHATAQAKRRNGTVLYISDIGSQN